MGNSLEDYRAAIGNFNIRVRKSISINNAKQSFLDIINTHLNCTFYFIALLTFQSLTPESNAVFLLFVLNTLLLIGNVESNPGPNSSSSTDDFILICNMNIRSIRNKLEFLHNFSDEFDILALTESHLDRNINNSDIYLDNYSTDIHRKDRTNHGGGLLIYFKDNICTSRKYDLENDIDETMWIEVKTRGQTFLLCHTNRPHWTDNDYWTRLTLSIELALSLNEKIVIVGDLNSDLLSIHNNKLFELINDTNLYNVINNPTRTSETSSTLLDPIILSESIRCIYSDVYPVPRDISDHDAAIASISCPYPKSNTFTREIWQYDKMDSNELARLIDEHEWFTDEISDVDEMCADFTKTFIDFARKCIPTKQVTIRSNDKPWFDNNLRREIRKRDRLRKKAIKSGSNHEVSIYKAQRNKVNNMKKIAKEKFENNLENFFLDNSPNPKTYWKIMKMLIKDTKGSNSMPPSKKYSKPKQS